MLCQDIFEYFDKTKDYSSIKSNSKTKELLDGCLIEYIKNKNANRINGMKKYIEIGFDINDKISGQLINWLELATFYNDIPMVGLLVKSNVNIHVISEDKVNMVFASIINKNLILLKYFLNLGVNPNHLNGDNITPLLLSCMMEDGYEYTKILLEHTSTLIEVPEQKFSIINVMVSNIDDGNIKYMELLEIALKKKKKYPTMR